MKIIRTNLLYRNSIRDSISKKPLTLEGIRKKALPKKQYLDTYTVKSGDTLLSISEKYNITVKELKDLNYFKNNIIYPNQILRIL